MKAVVYNGPWDMDIIDLPIPEVGAEEALLRVDAVGICGSDIHGFTGESGRRAPGMGPVHRKLWKICGGSSLALPVCIVPDRAPLCYHTAAHIHRGTSIVGVKHSLLNTLLYNNCCSRNTCSFPSWREIRADGGFGTLNTRIATKLNGWTLKMPVA